MALSLVMSNDKDHRSVTYRITFPDPISLGIRSVNLCPLSGCQAVSERFWLQAFSCRDYVIVPWAGELQVAIAPDSFYRTLPTNNSVS